MSMDPNRLRLSDLKEGDRFILVRSGRKYLLKNKEGTRYVVKPIGHTVGATRFDGSFHGLPCTLHYNSYVELI